MRTGEIVGFEALFRWRYPHSASVPAREFIPIAEETGLIIPMGEWALGEACRQLRRWRSMAPVQTPAWISVNLSRRQLAHTDLIRRVAEILKETGLEPLQLMLEVTESSVIDNADLAARMLEKFRSMGIRIAVDDFGTGYSSLSLLQQLPIDVVKIDRSFISELDGTASPDCRMLRGIINLASSMGLTVIAEGVERLEQTDILRDLGCVYAQGHYFSHPKDAVSLTQHLERVWSGKEEDDLRPAHGLGPAVPMPPLTLGTPAGTHDS